MPSSSEEKTQTKRKARTFRKDGYWFFQFAEDIIFGPFDRVIETVMADREVNERELDNHEATRLLLEFA